MSRLRLATTASQRRIKPMREITLEELLEAGCHFGHQVNRRNPKADEFIFEERDKVHIINLEKTHEGLIKAAQFLKDLSAKGGNLVIVGTKKQARNIVLDEVKRAKDQGVTNLNYITTRWIGGMLTNFDEVAKNYKKLKELTEFLASNKTNEYTKREILEFTREKAKLETLYGGIADLKRTPDAIFIIDTHLETTAVDESKKVGAKTIGIVDTNADPSDVTYSIPANDDAVGSIKIILNYIVDAWIEGQKRVENAELKVENETKKKKTPKASTQEAKVKEESKSEDSVEAKPKRTRKKKTVEETVANS